MRPCTKYGATLKAAVLCAHGAFLFSWTSAGSVSAAPVAPAKNADVPLNDTISMLELCPASKGTRTLKFPKDYSLGEIVIRPFPPVGSTGEMRGGARGTVVVPPNRFVEFVPSQHFYKNPAIIKTLPPDGIDSLELTASAMFDGEEGLCDRALAEVGHLKGLANLNLDRSDATDKGLAFAGQLPNLQKISAFTAAIQGDSFKNLVTCKKMRVLRLSRLWLKDDNFKYLSQMPNLQYLVLTRGNVTDLGIKHLSNCPSLIQLSMADNPKVTDKSIPYLLKMKNLRNLILGGTSITGNGLVQLKALPLKALQLPGPEAGITNLHELRKVLAGVHLSVPTGKKLNSEMDTILAPMH